MKSTTHGFSSESIEVDAISSEHEADMQSSSDVPSVDETTRLKSRIVELESLISELRGLAATNAPIPMNIANIY